MRKIKGFSLLELMITLGIVSLLASFAVVIYQQPTLKTKQTAAKMGLTKLAATLEDFYEEHQTYQGMIPDKEDNKDYEWKIVASSQEHFKLAAIPKIVMKGDQCGTFYLDDEGNKTVSGKSIDCW